MIVGLGLSEEGLQLLFTETAVFIGLLQLFLPLMIIALISSMENMPRDVVPAARVLGANWFSVFFRVILPLTREGLVVGGTLVFAGSIAFEQHTMAMLIGTLLWFGSAPYWMKQKEV